MSCDVQALFPATDANKYSRGKLTVVAGSARYPGAAVLAARAGQRMGAGYTEVITHESAVNTVRLSSPSLVVRAFSQWDARELPPMREGKPAAVCVGPGFVPGSEESASLVKRTMKTAQCPVLYDGGALAHLSSAKSIERLRKREEDGFATVITPHGGEARRIADALGVHIVDPENLAKALAYALRCVVVLKGPDTFVSDGRRVHAMREGTPALAKAGTGDVLAGMIGALLAQGANAFEAAVLGATLHAHAGRLAAERFTEVCVCAEDVVDAIPAVLKANAADSGVIR